MPSRYELELQQLVDHPDENLATEIKDWLDLSDRVIRADVAKELIALANHGGGYLLFGFSEAADGWSPSPSDQVALDHYSQDSINDILKRHAEPVFECHTAHITSSAGTLHVVVRVPGGHLVPIRSRGGPEGSRLSDHQYYIRRPGAESAPPDNAREWDELIARCVENHHERQLESFRRIIAVMQASPEVMSELSALAAGDDPLTKWIEQSRERHPGTEPL